MPRLTDMPNYKEAKQTAELRRWAVEQAVQVVKFVPGQNVVDNAKAIENYVLGREVSGGQ